MRLLIFYIILFIVIKADAQLYFNHKDVKLFSNDGKNIVNPSSFYRDSKGFLWLGGYGIERFDGFHYKSYANKTEGKVYGKFIEDNKGRLFVATSHDGIYCYSNVKDDFQLFQDSIEVKGEKVYLDIQTLVSINGDIWAACKDFIAVLKSGSNKFIDITKKLKLPNGGDYVLFSTDDKNNIYCGSFKLGLLKINTNDYTVNTKSNKPLNEKIFNYNFGRAYLHYNAKHSEFWVIKFNNYGPEHWVDRYDVKNDKWTRYLMPYPNNVKFTHSSTWPHNIDIDKNGGVWISMGEMMGIAQYNRKNDRLDLNYTHELLDDYSNKASISLGTPSYPIYIDNFNTLWSFRKSIYNFSTNQQQVDQISTSNIWPNLTEPNNIHFMNQPVSYVSSLPDKNTLFFSRGLGLTKWNSNEQITQKITISNLQNQKIRRAVSYGFNCILIDEELNIYKYNIQTNELSLIKCDFLKKNNIGYDKVIGNQYWIDTYGDGMISINIESGQYDIYPLPSDVEARVFEREDKSKIWIGTYGKGLLLYDLNKKSIIDSFNHHLNKTHKSLHFYTDVKHYEKDEILLGSSNGLIIFNKKTRKYTKIDKAQGLIDEQITSFSNVYKNKIICMTSEKGLALIDLKKRKAQHIYKNNEGRYDAGYKTFLVDDKIVLTSTSAGFYAVDTMLFYNVGNKVKLEITNISIDNKNKTISDKITIDEGRNDLEIQFANLNDENLYDTRYEVWLKGYDNGWQPLNEPTLFYKTLNSGEYDLMVRTILPNLDVKEFQLATINVKPPIHKRWWFYLILVAGISFLINQIQKIRYQQRRNLDKQKWENLQLSEQNIRSKLELETLNKALVETKLQAIHAQMNPHFIFNSLNSIENFILKNDKLQASNYLNKFAKLIRAVLENTKHGEITIFADYQVLLLYIELEQMRFKDKFILTIDIDQHLWERNYLIPPFLIQPFVENAILHGIGNCTKSQCLLSIKIIEKPDFLEITITDDGAGRRSTEIINSKKKKSSEGFSISKQRINLFNNNTIDDEIAIEDLYDDQNNPLGTTVILKILKKVKQYK